MFSKLLPAVTAAVLALAAPLSATTDSASEHKLEALERSILLVGANWTGFINYPAAGGGRAWSNEVSAFTSCTGWFASEEGHIVTAGHCVDPREGRTALLATFLAENNASDLLPEAIADWPVQGHANGEEIGREMLVIQPKEVDGAPITDATRAQVVDFEPFKDGDVALLHVANLDKPTPALEASGIRPGLGDPVTAIGFPGSVMNVADGARLRASFKSGTVSSNQISNQGVAGTEVNADISPGMSGGPTVDQDGRVLGVNSFTVSGETRNFNFITSSQDLKTFLNRNDVKFEPAEAAAQQPQASTSAPASGSPAAGAGIPGPAATGPTSAAREGPKENTAIGGGLRSAPMMLVWIIGGVAAAALIALASFMLARRKRPAGQGGPAGAGICGNCGQLNPPQAQFCSKCGSHL